MGSGMKLPECRDLHVPGLLAVLVVVSSSSSSSSSSSTWS